MPAISVDNLKKTYEISEHDEGLVGAVFLGLGRTKAYELARRGQFPCRVIRIGEVYRIPTPGLLELLGVPAEEPRPPTVLIRH